MLEHQMMWRRAIPDLLGGMLRRRATLAARSRHGARLTLAADARDGRAARAVDAAYSLHHLLRGTPLLVQSSSSITAPAQFDGSQRRRSGDACARTGRAPSCFSLNTRRYTAEILRGAIHSRAARRAEAEMALGTSPEWSSLGGPCGAPSAWRCQPMATRCIGDDQELIARQHDHWLESRPRAHPPGRAHLRPLRDLPR